jgi:hypothetical protein
MIQVVLKNGKYAIYNTKGGSIPPVVSSVTIPTNIVVNTPISVSYTIVGLPTTITRTWYRGVAVIATSTTSDLYTPVQADAGNASNIKCVVTATNAGGSGTADSNTVAQVLTVRTNSFLTASAISDATIRGGLNTFDIGLISNSLDTKMKAVYPFVGGTASTHRWNFMNAVDTNAAFRLTFSGTWTHSSNGALPNGVNAFANTFLNASTNLTLSNHSFGFYSRTENISGSQVIGAAVTAVPNFFQNNISGGNFVSGEIGTLISYTPTPTRAFLFASRTTTSLFKAYRNNTILGSNTATLSTLPNLSFYFGARNQDGSASFYTSYEHAFAFIGDGLSDTDATNLYNLTQALQTTLGRSVGPQTVSDPYAQAFVTAADIQDQVQADAVNTLVIGMKAQGLWTKMKAVYPMVGGTATSHMYNLKDPRNLDAAYRLQFTGGWTHSALGALPNGSNTLARTYLVPTTALNTNDHALFFYLNTNNPNVAVDPLDMGSIEDVNRRLVLYSRLDVFGGTADAAAVSIPYVAPAACFALITKQSATVSSAFKNATKVATAASGGTPPPLYDIIFGNIRIQGTPYGAGWSTNRFAMVGISDGLSDADSVNLYNLTQTFQTTLGRQV